MKILIAYASTSGTAAKCARLLAEECDDATVIELGRESASLASFDVIVVGGSIRMGMLHKDAKRFLEKNHDALLAKPCAYFICCADESGVDTYFKDNFPHDLLAASLGYASFGGDTELKRQKGLDRLILRLAMKQKAPDGQQASILYEHIHALAERIKGEA